MRLLALLLVACASPAPHHEVATKKHAPPSPPPPDDTTVPADYWSGPLPACSADMATTRACKTVGDRCAYSQGICLCMSECHGGAALREPAPPRGPAWECYPTPPPRTDGCPDTPPTGACSGAHKCGYGRPNIATCMGIEIDCVDGRWTPVQPEPPP